MPGRDKGGSAGRSEEDRLRDLAARERAREEGRRPPPSFGPSTRAGRERAAREGGNSGAAPSPPPARRVPDAGFDFDFAQPSTRAAGGASVPSPAAAPEPESVETFAQTGETATATVASPHPSSTEPPSEPGQTPRVPRSTDAGPEFAPLASAAARRTERQARRAAARKPAKPAGTGERLRRRRAAIAAAAAGVVLLLGAVAIAGDGGDEPAKDTAAAAAKKKPSPYGEPTLTPLPPETRIVAYTGAPQAKELGILGTMPFERASDRLDRQAVPYDRKSRPVLRAFDLIATIANAHPGPAGKYRTRQPSTVIARYLRAARRHDAALILDVQPGTSNFVDEIKPLERWLKEPDVHLALDPEWRMRPGVQPGSEIGWVSAGEVTATLNRVARVVRANKLPPKLVIVHRFTDGMIKNLDTVHVPKEVVGVISIDGVGTRTQKIHTYDRIAPTLPKPWLPGFKLFYVEDKAAGGMLSGKQTMSLTPRPDVVLYE